MSGLDLDIEFCRERQRRLVAEMERRDLDWTIVCQTQHVQWLTGVRVGWVFQSAAVLTVDGQLILAVPNKAPESAAADSIATFPAQHLATLRNDQRAACSEALWEALQDRPRPKRVGVEYSSFPQQLAGRIDAPVLDIEPCLIELRRRKLPDELQLIRKAIAGTQAMYERARQIIRPGIQELEVFNQLQAAAVEEFGEMLTGTGNDYQCASPGGPPRAGRTAHAGELYILDLGPAYRGYFADNCRTVAVSDASDAQTEAWDHLMRVFEHVEATVRPGKSARALYAEAQEILSVAPRGEFPHHLGHGIGLFPHEPPHLNPHWDDVFQEGEVFAVEPGLYAPELKSGMRIEQNYRVTKDGLERLTDFPLEL